jgi:hypothetical protein
MGKMNQALSNPAAMAVRGASKDVDFCVRCSRAVTRIFDPRRYPRSGVCLCPECCDWALIEQRSAERRST